MPKKSIHLSAVYFFGGGGCLSWALLNFGFSSCHKTCNWCYTKSVISHVYRIPFKRTCPWSHIYMSVKRDFSLKLHGPWRTSSTVPSRRPGIPLSKVSSESGKERPCMILWSWEWSWQWSLIFSHQQCNPIHTYQGEGPIDDSETFLGMK